MLSIRFTRIGRKKAPLYRVVIMDKRKDPWGKYLEKLGFYNPITKETQLNKERIEYWISQGAQCSESVHNLLVKNEVIKADKKKSVKITKKRTAKIEDKKKKSEDAKAKALADEEAKKAEEAKVEEAIPSVSAEATADNGVPVIEEAKVEQTSTPVEEKTE